MLGMKKNSWRCLRIELLDLTLIFATHLRKSIIIKNGTLTFRFYSHFSSYLFGEILCKLCIF